MSGVKHSKKISAKNGVTPFRAPKGRKQAQIDKEGERFYQKTTYMLGFACCYSNPLLIPRCSLGDCNPWFHYDLIGKALGIDDFNDYHRIYQRRYKIIDGRLIRSKQELLKLAKNYIKRKKIKLLNDTIGVTYNMPKELITLIGTYL